MKLLKMRKLITNKKEKKLKEERWHHERRSMSLLFAFSSHFGWMANIQLATEIVHIYAFYTYLVKKYDCKREKIENFNYQVV